MFILNKNQHIYIYIYKRAFVDNHSSEETRFFHLRDNNVVAPVGGTK